MRTSAVLVAIAAAALRGPAATAQAGGLPDAAPCSGCYAPALETSWQWQVQGPVDTSVDVSMYDIDGFEATTALVDQLHTDGRSVVCYLSAGSWEKWRPDAGKFPDSVKGRDNGWPGERWLDIRALRVLRPIMEHRLDMCAAKG